MNIDFSKLAVVAVILLFAGLLWFQDQALQEETGGNARVVDGDSLEIEGDMIRLKGIDAPEGQQKCRKNEQEWSCGREATRALRQLIKGQKVVCKGNEYDRYQRLLGYCSAGSVDLNKTMVAEGWALSFGGDFLAEESVASQQKKGIWSGEFQRPQDWRRDHPRF